MKIAFLFYEGMTALDAIGPHELLSRFPEAKVFRFAEQPGKILTDSGLTLLADYSFDECFSVDILLIPGAGTATTFQSCSRVLDWIRLMHQETKWTTSVCTGSLILGAAGILEGKQATTHWAASDRLERFGANFIQERVVEDGKILTAAGVSAGIDLALTLAIKVVGMPFAERIQLALEYDPQPPINKGSPAKADPDLRRAVYERLLKSFENQ